MQAAEAIAFKYRELNAATSYPATLYYLSTTPIDRLWGTQEARQKRIDFYLRYVAIYDRERRRSALGQVERRDTDGHYAGVVIRLLQRKFPGMDAGEVFTVGEVALNLITWTRARYPDMPRALVCDVMLAMNGYFGIELEEEPREGDRSGPEDEKLSTVGDIALKIGVSVATALLIYALTRGRRR
jgi:hypothetical protein